MKQALEALNEVTGWTWAGPMRVMDEVEDAITTLRQAIADAEKQEPAVYIPADALRQITPPLLILRGVSLYGYRGDGLTPLYTHPQPKRECDMGVMCIECPDAQPKCDPLTAEDFLDWYDSAIWGNEDFKECCRIAFEAGWQAAHGIKAD